MFLPIFISILGAGLGYANPILHFPLAVTIFPATLAYVGLNAESRKNAFKNGWLCGSAASLICMYWIAVPIGLYGGISWLIAMPCPVLVAMFIGLYYGLYTWAISLGSTRLSPFLLCIFSGILWTTMETLQGVLFTGFPWMTLASAFSTWTDAVQGAAYIGAYGLSGLIVMLSTAVLFIKRSKACAVLIIFCLAVTFGAAYQRIYSPVAIKRISESPTVTVGVIQGNIDQSKKWDKKYQDQTLDKYINLTKSLDKNVDIAVWPETAMPFFIQEAGDLRFKLFQFLKDSRIPLLTGAPGYTLHSDKNNYSLFNRAYFIDSAHNTVDWYDKHHLVPFGEYVPLKDYLPIGKLVEGVGDFIPGTGSAPIITGRLAMGILICYEGIFPELAQKRVKNGANLLINISNDAWYGRSSTPYQHLSLVALRSVEQGRALIRGTNTGISCTINPYGKIEHASPLFEDAAFTAKVPLLVERTFYSINYNWITIFPPAISAVILLWLILTAFLNKKNLKPIIKY